MLRAGVRPHVGKLSPATSNTRTLTGSEPWLRYGAAALSPVVSGLVRAKACLVRCSGDILGSQADGTVSTGRFRPS